MRVSRSVFSVAFSVREDALRQARRSTRIFVEEPQLPDLPTFKFPAIDGGASQTQAAPTGVTFANVPSPTIPPDQVQALLLQLRAQRISAPITRPVAAPQSGPSQQQLISAVQQAVVQALKTVPIQQTIHVDNDQTNNFAVGANGSGGREASDSIEAGLGRFTSALIDELNR